MSRIRTRLMYLLTALAIALVALIALVRWIEPRVAFVPFPGESETPRDFALPYEPLTITTADGERLRAWLMPVPAPRGRIVYFHGNGGNLSNWSPILAEIARRGYSVFAIDYRGYGLSTGRPTERGVYRDVEAAVARAWPGATDRTPLVYWGRSLGATMAAHAATVRTPDGVILEAGFPDAATAVRGSLPLAFLSLFSSYRFPTAALMNRANVSVLLVHGDRDRVIPIEVGRELFRRINGPKEFVVIAGGDHNDAVAPDPQAYWSAIDRFIGSLAR